MIFYKCCLTDIYNISHAIKLWQNEKKLINCLKFCLGTCHFLYVLGSKHWTLWYLVIGIIVLILFNFVPWYLSPLTTPTEWDGRVLWMGRGVIPQTLKVSLKMRPVLAKLCPQSVKYFSKQKAFSLAAPSYFENPYTDNIFHN